MNDIADIMNDDKRILHALFEEYIRTTRPFGSCYHAIQKDIWQYCGPFKTTHEGVVLFYKNLISKEYLFATSQIPNFQSLNDNEYFDALVYGDIALHVTPKGYNKLNSLIPFNLHWKLYLNERESLQITFAV